MIAIGPAQDRQARQVRDLRARRVLDGNPCGPHPDVVHAVPGVAVAISFEN